MFLFSVLILFIHLGSNTRNCGVGYITITSSILSLNILIIANQIINKIGCILRFAGNIFN
jgi:hypothetical protein